MNQLLVIAATSYLLGSIPFGYLFVQLFHGEDVRLSGSGNIGATNVSRKSPALGAATLVFDALKGSAAVYLARRLSMGTPQSGEPYSTMAMAAFFAVFGHIFPIWLKFHGGKGVATGLGAFLLISPRSVLVAAGIFILVVAIFRYVSLGSIVAVASFPIMFWIRAPQNGDAVALALTTATSLLIIARHHTNIRRLVGGMESRLGAKRP